jgi:hypothetical protein
MTIELETKQKIRQYLYNNIPPNFRQIDYYKYFDESLEWSGGYDTALSICLFMQETKEKLTAKNLKQFLLTKLI